MQTKSVLQNGSNQQVILWGINYAPEVVGIAVYTTELAQYLQAANLTVTAVTAFPYYPSWRLSKECPLYRSDRVNGVQVERCWLYVPHSPSLSRRILHELSFALMSFLRLLTLPRADAYVVMSPPLILGFFAWILCAIKRSKFIFHVQDLQPDATIALGMIKQGLFYKSLKVLERLCYTRAALVTCISQQMRERIIATRIPAEKVRVFPNWTKKTTPIRGWRSKAGISETKFVVSYSGNLGFKQGLDIIVEAARLLVDQSDIQFVIGGEGSQKEHLTKLASQYQLKNVMFQGLLDEENHTSMLSETDLFLVPQKPGSGAIFFPSKLLKALQLKLPVLTNAEETSSLNQAVQEGGFGVIVPSHSPDEFASMIVNLKMDREQRMHLSKNSSIYAEQFTGENVLPQFLTILEEVGSIGSTKSKPTCSNLSD